MSANDTRRPDASGRPDDKASPLQPDLFDQTDEPSPQERALIEQLIAATKLYDTSDAVAALLQFTTRLRGFAPFNAMLLHIQKPGLTHAATAADWHNRFGRAPKRGARPLVILITKGPVDFVFDIQDTEGKDVPVDAFAFPTLGKLSEAQFKSVIESISHDRIELLRVDQGDGKAGMIELIERSTAAKGKHRYRITYNGNHDAPTRFTTVAHELGHLFLGHLGEDKGRRVPDRSTTSHALREVEAEMAAYLVACRNGVTPRSESYLAGYKGAIASLNLYAVARAANAIETAMGISATKLWAEKGEAQG